MNGVCIIPWYTVSGGMFVTDGCAKTTNNQPYIACVCAPQTPAHLAPQNPSPSVNYYDSLPFRAPLPRRADIDTYLWPGTGVKAAFEATY